MDEKRRTVHLMNLNQGPFDAIKSGRKTVEMRLNDEKRQMIKIGDLIRFTNTVTDEKLTVKVVDRIVYPSFFELYSAYDKTSIGYGECERADPSDMLEYYAEDRIKKYGALALVIELI
jgi:ASC-1-like (ASCH) protein